MMGGVHKVTPEGINLRGDITSVLSVIPLQANPNSSSKCRLCPTFTGNGSLIQEELQLHGVLTLLYFFR